MAETVAGNCTTKTTARACRVRYSQIGTQNPWEILRVRLFFLIPEGRRFESCAGCSSYVNSASGSAAEDSDRVRAFQLKLSDACPWDRAPCSFLRRSIPHATRVC